MQVESLGGSLYYFLLIDDFSRMSWVYFLKNKSQAFQKFKVFKRMVEKESEHHIKVLRTDRGGEFCSNDFNQFCESNGIKRELTVSYTPQHNGVVERKNRTIMGMTRSMLKERGLPKCFWAEGVATAVYLLNRAVTKAVENKTPYEMWYGHKPSVHHLRIFGCIAYGHVTAHQRRKLDDRAVKCIFIGYALESKGYRLYNPINKKIEAKRNVVFLEHHRWKWEESDNKSEEACEIGLDDPFPTIFHEQNGPVDGDNSHSSDNDVTSQERENEPPSTIHANTSSHAPTIHPNETIHSPLSHASHSNAAPPTPNSHGSFTITPISFDSLTTSPTIQSTHPSHSPNERIVPSKRQIKPPTWLQDFESGEGLSDDEAQFFALSIMDPTSYQEATAKKEWQQAMKNEIDTIEYGIWYEKGVPIQLQGYTDSDWASSVDDRKSVSANVFSLGSGAVSWSSRKQNVVALSSTEAEYVASSGATSQAVWLRRILGDLNLHQEAPTVVFCDNHSAINLTKNPIMHARTKHIEIKHHYIRDMVAKQEITLKYCGTDMQVADVLTKALGREKFTRFRLQLGVEEFGARGDDESAPKIVMHSG